MQYDGRLTNVPLSCSNISKMDIQHAKGCKKGGFVMIRQKDLCDVTATLMREVYEDIDIEPVTGETFDKGTTNIRTEVRVDIIQKGFWLRGQKSFQ